MAKTTSKPATSKIESKPESKAKPKAKAAAMSLEEASEEALKKLQALGIEPELQSELQWCLGSYRFDRNPSGLYETAGRAVAVLNEEKSKKTKGVTAKFVSDLEKAVKPE